MEFHGEFSMEIHTIPWNSMEVFHTARTCLLNLVITDHCFSRFVYIALVLIFFPFFNYYE